MPEVKGRPSIQVEIPRESRRFSVEVFRMLDAVSTASEGTSPPKSLQRRVSPLRTSMTMPRPTPVKRDEALPTLRRHQTISPLCVSTQRRKKSSKSVRHYVIKENPDLRVVPLPCMVPTPFTAEIVDPDAEEGDLTLQNKLDSTCDLEEPTETGMSTPNTLIVEESPVLPVKPDKEVDNEKTLHQEPVVLKHSGLTFKNQAEAFEYIEQLVATSESEQEDHHAIEQDIVNLFLKTLVESTSHLDSVSSGVEIRKESSSEAEGETAMDRYYRKNKNKLHAELIALQEVRFCLPGKKSNSI